MRWASKNRDKRKALAQLGMFEELTAQTRKAGHQTMAEMAALMERARARGTMAEAPFPLLRRTRRGDGGHTLEARQLDEVGARAAAIEVMLNARAVGFLACVHDVARDRIVVDA
jgi:hypothetical protein